MLYIVKKWDAGIRGTCWRGDGVGGVWCGAGVVVGCGLEDIYSFTPGHFPTQTFTHLDTQDKFETNIMFSEMPFRISIRGNVIWTKCLFNEKPCILTFEC